MSKDANLKPEFSEKKLKNTFSKVKRELEEHLEAINENTNEIQSNYESLLRLESKIDKLSSRMNDIERFITQFKHQNVYFLDEEESDSFTIIPLTDEEKKIFKMIYELEAENIRITYPKLADMLGISTSLSQDYVMSLIEKGIPIMKNYLNHKIYISLEPKFRDQQTRKNIINL